MARCVWAPWGGSTAGDVSTGCIPVVNQLRAMFPLVEIPVVDHLPAMFPLVVFRWWSNCGRCFHGLYFDGGSAAGDVSTGCIPVVNQLRAMYVSTDLYPGGESTTGDVSTGSIPVVKQLRAVFPRGMFKWRVHCGRWWFVSMVGFDGRAR